MFLVVLWDSGEPDMQGRSYPDDDNQMNHRHPGGFLCRDVPLAAGNGGADCHVMIQTRIEAAAKAPKRERRH